MERYGTYELINGAIANRLNDEIEEIKKENKTLRNTLLYIRKEIRNKEMPCHEENELYNYITDTLNNA